MSDTISELVLGRVRFIPGEAYTDEQIVGGPVPVSRAYFESLDRFDDHPPTYRDRYDPWARLYGKDTWIMCQREPTEEPGRLVLVQNRVNLID